MLQKTTERPHEFLPPFDGERYNKMKTGLEKVMKLYPVGTTFRIAKEGLYPLELFQDCDPEKRKSGNSTWWHKTHFVVMFLALKRLEYHWRYESEIAEAVREALYN